MSRGVLITGEDTDLHELKEGSTRRSARRTSLACASNRRGESNPQRLAPEGFCPLRMPAPPLPVEPRILRDPPQCRITPWPDVRFLLRGGAPPSFAVLSRPLVLRRGPDRTHGIGAPWPPGRGVRPDPESAPGFAGPHPDLYIDAAPSLSSSRGPGRPPRRRRVGSSAPGAPLSRTPPRLHHAPCGDPQGPLPAGCPPPGKGSWSADRSMQVNHVLTLGPAARKNVIAASFMLATGAWVAVLGDLNGLRGGSTAPLDGSPPRPASPSSVESAALPLQRPEHHQRRLPQNPGTRRLIRASPSSCAVAQDRQAPDPREEELSTRAYLGSSARGSASASARRSVTQAARGADPPLTLQPLVENAIRHGFATTGRYVLTRETAGPRPPAWSTTGMEWRRPRGDGIG